MNLVWFRQDLRLEDNPALSEALADGGPVAPVFIWDEAGEGAWPPGAASRWWLHHSLLALERSLRARGLPLVVRRGSSQEVLAELSAETRAAAVRWNRRYEPAARQRDAAIMADLTARGIAVKTFNSALLFEPQDVANREGRPFQVFGPFWRHCLTRAVAPPVVLPQGRWRGPRKRLSSLSIAELGLLPKSDWAKGFQPLWKPGEAGAQEQLVRFLRSGVAEYQQRRDRPDLEGTSRLSPWLSHGEIGPRQIWAALRKRSHASGVFPLTRGDTAFLAEIGWREFAYHILYHFPTAPERPLRPRFERFPWADDPGGRLLRLWQKGETGFPIVDAAMRQLWATGWMHNRARMITASFLVKDLRLPWLAGARWFWDTLVDADLANNTLGWQWSAGCGADAAPYFRVFSPDRQASKFDPEGAYVRRWAGRTDEGPPPCVDHAAARAAALAAFRAISAVPPRGLRVERRR